VSYDGCTCDCGYDDDGDRFEFNRISYPTARKTHKCDECGGAIQPGQKFELSMAKWAGGLSACKTCDLCRRIRENHCSCSPYGSMRDDIWECMGFDYVTGDMNEDDDEVAP